MKRNKNTYKHMKVTIDMLTGLATLRSYKGNLGRDDMLKIFRKNVCVKCKKFLKCEINGFDHVFYYKEWPPRWKSYQHTMICKKFRPTSRGGPIVLTGKPER